MCLNLEEVSTTRSSGWVRSPISSGWLRTHPLPQVVLTVSNHSARSVPAPSIPPQGADAARFAIFALDGVADHCGRDDAAVFKREQRRVWRGVFDLAAREHTASRDF